MLYIVATPIGNLEDMTFRAIRTLKEVDYIFAEDTRVTKKLLDHYEIKNTVYRYDEHTKQHQVANIINLLKEEKNYIRYLIEKSYLSEIHAKEFIDYEKKIIEDL